MASSNRFMRLGWLWIMPEWKLKPILRKRSVKLEQAIEGLNSTIRDIRTYIMDLRPRQFRGENLKDSLQRLIDETRANTNLDISLTGPEDGALILPTVIATALFHISQEALANIAKHAQAKSCQNQPYNLLQGEY